MTRKQFRLVFIAGALGVIGVSVGLMLFALRDSVALFLSPSEIADKGIKPGARLRIGGLVAKASTDKTADKLAFAITDGAHDIGVDCTGACYGGIPDLFREGQGVVAEGVLAPSGRLQADQILAKHDERYMPREVVEALKKQGRWQEGQ
ncbi:MAG: cytochrome c maturation protein CcmE [Pseudomonadota bacterium]|nr:cytochrome c maturation protein CcmE [Pseudomonadota bacterium]